MKLKRKARILAAGKSPSLMVMKRTYNRAILNGGVTQDFSANVENIREISRDLGYNILSDAPFVYVPSSYGEGKNFAQVQNKRNLLQWSEDFSNAFYIRNNMTLTANSTNAPNGTLTADSFVETTANASHYISLTTTVGIVSLSTTYTLSAYVKSNGRQWTVLNFFNSIDNAAYFDIINGVVGTVFGGGVSAKISNEGNGWFRCSITKLSTTSTTANAYIMAALADNSNTNYVGDITKGLVIYGFQLETGAYATPYQKTVAAGDGIVDFNFTRATRSSVTNKLGIIEDSCYNLLQRSEEFDNAIWNKTLSTVQVNQTSNPINNLVDADLLKQDGIASTFSRRVSAIVSLNGTYTLSCYVKKKDLNGIFLQIVDNTTTYGASFNTITGAFISGNISIGATNSEVLSNGWFRFSITVTTTNIIRIDIGLHDGTTTVLDNTDTFGNYIWGAQLTQGSTPRPYLRTTNRLNVPKLDYSLSLSEPSLLIEPQRTNLLLQSDNLGTTPWGGNASTITANTNLNPFGTNKSFYINEANTSLSTSWVQNNSITSGTIYTASFYIKKADDSWCQFTLGTAAFGTDTWKNFNFDTGLFGNGGATGIWNVKQVTNGYWLITVTATAIATVTATSVAIAGVNNIDSATRLPVYTGSVRKFADISAIQLEAGANATTYIPTTTATVTRNAETSYVDLFNNSVLNQNNFTLFVEGYLYGNATTNLSVGLSDTTATGARANDIGFFDGIKATRTSSSVTTSDTVNLAVNNYYKFAIQRDGTSVKFFRNGVQVWTTQVVPVVNYRYLVINNGGSTFTVDKAFLFSRTLTDSECIDITS